MLILFDIDMTLLKTNGAGRRAMAATGQRLFSPDFAFEGVDFAGRLDPLIIRELLAANGVAPTPDNLAAMRAGYIEAFAATAAESIEALPGAVELVRAIVADASTTPGVLTGNFPETGTFKLRTIGLDPAEFRVQVWGDDSPHDPPARDHLPPVGIDRYRALHSADPRETVILGDTEHDVACGLANGCRVLAVATGRTDAQTLKAAGAHRVVEDLTDTQGIADWLLNG